jgi:hypothetical protein
MNPDAIAFHTVELYTGKNKPKDGHRLSVTTFKSLAKFTEKEVDGKPNPDFDATYKKPDARCVSVPSIKLECTPAIIKDAMQQALEDMQDAAIRELIIAALDEKKSIINIHEDQINYEAIARFAAENAASGKLTKDGIEGWFDDELADVLTLKLANKMQLPDNATAEQNKKLANAVTNYKGVFLSLAAPKAGLSPKIAVQLKNVIDLCENKDSRMFKVLQGKIVAHLELKDPVLVGL